MIDANETCPAPPHPDMHGHAALQPRAASPSALGRFRGWVMRAPAERLPLPAVPAVWTAAEIMHAAHVPGYIPACATCAAAGIAWLAQRWRGRKSEYPQWAADEAAILAAVPGSWVTAADIWGPLAGGSPYPLTIAYAAGSAIGYWRLRSHKSAKAARARRDAQAAWLARRMEWVRLAPQLGLQGSHLLDHKETLLGETWLIDVRGTGKRASKIDLDEVAELYAEIEMIPQGRIDVTRERLPGRIRITVRRKDPWAKPLMHPAVHGSSPFAKHVQEPATCRRPLVIGGDPESGEPLTLTLWDPEEGGKVVVVAAKKGSGKTVALNCISERVTACPDAILIQVNLGKHREDRRWAPLAAANALGRDERKRARLTLQWVVDVIEERSKSGDDSKVQPTEKTPLIVVKVDEIDQVADDPVCAKWLSLIASKCRSECVSLIFAGQRGTADWMGGADLRANIDTAVIGRFAQKGEADFLIGDLAVPDMGEYGEGHPGVWAIVERGGGGWFDRGRVFKLEDLREVDKIVARRLKTRRAYVPEPALEKLSGLWAKVTGDIPAGNDEPATGTSALEQALALAESMNADIQELNAAINGAPRPADEAQWTDQEALAVANHLAAKALGVPDTGPHAALAAKILGEADPEVPDWVLPDMRGNYRTMLVLLARREGVSAAELGEKIGLKKTAAFTNYLNPARADGTARLDGSGPAQRWRLASSPVPAGQRPSLVVLPGGGSGEGDDEAEGGVS